MEPTFLIRRVDVANALMRAAISTMHEECYDASDNPYTPDIKGVWWVAFCGKVEAGFAGIVASAQLAQAGYLCRAGVLPRYRGRGLQARLIRLRLKYARQQGWNAVFTDTRCNPASANSLINCGFKMYEPANPWSLSGAVYWRKTLV